MSFDFTITISVILGFSAIFVPLLGNIVSACHDTKIKKLELSESTHKNYILHKRDILEDAISHLGKFSTVDTVESLSGAGEALAKALPYLDGETYQQALKVLNFMLANDSFDTVAIKRSIEGITVLLKQIEESH